MITKSRRISSFSRTINYDENFITFISFQRRNIVRLAEPERERLTQESRDDILRYRKFSSF